MKIRISIFLSTLSFLVLGLGGGLGASQQDAASAARRVIIFVWDGLRTDDVTPENMPNYFALARSGVVFADHHAVYPAIPGGRQNLVTTTISRWSFRKP